MKCSFTRLCAFFTMAVANLCAAQSMGSSGSLVGTVTDPSGGIIPKATVNISNTISHYKNEVKTDSSGTFKFNNIAFGRYHIVVNATGFQPVTRDAEVRTSV